MDNLHTDKGIFGQKWPKITHMGHTRLNVKRYMEKNYFITDFRAK